MKEQDKKIECEEHIGQKCIQDINSKFETLTKKIETQIDETQDIKHLMGEIITIQKNTTENLNVLTNDVKEILTDSLSFEAHRKELKNLQNRIEGLEENKTWLTRLIIGSFLTAIASLLFGGRIF